jgi:hypothetical protein
MGKNLNGPRYDIFRLDQHFDLNLSTIDSCRIFYAMPESLRLSRTGLKPVVRRKNGNPPTQRDF